MFTARYVLHSTFCPHSVFMCFVCIWEQTAIIWLYSINWLVFITEVKSVYCAVRNESLTKTHVNVQRAKDARQTTSTDGVKARAVWPSRSTADGGHLLGQRGLSAVSHSTHPTLTYHEFRNARLLYDTGNINGSIISRGFEEAGRVAGIGQVTT